MESKVLINRLRLVKEEKGYTLFDLSKKLDVQITTLGRWLKTNRINRMYAQMVEQRLEEL